MLEIQDALGYGKALRWNGFISDLVKMSLAGSTGGRLS
jgi:hypothetical protein